MTDSEFDPAVLRELFDAATPGPWNMTGPMLLGPDAVVCETDGLVTSDSRLIVYLRNHAAELLEQIEQAWSEGAQSYEQSRQAAQERDEALEKAAELRDGMAQALDACEEARQRASDMHRLFQRADAALEKARAEVKRLRALLANAEDIARYVRATVGVGDTIPFPGKPEWRGAVAGRMESSARQLGQLIDQIDALDIARARLEDPEGTPLDEAEEFVINDDHGGYVPDVVLAICRGETAPNSAENQQFDFDEPLPEDWPKELADQVHFVTAPSDDMKDYLRDSNDLPTNEAIRSAGRVARVLLAMGVQVDAVRCSGAGGVGLARVSGDVYAHVEVLNSGSIGFLVKDKASGECVGVHFEGPLDEAAEESRCE